MELTVTGLNKKYIGYDGEPTFSLEIEEILFDTGKVIFIMGHNGSGKSILIKLISGQILPSNGHVYIYLSQKKYRADRMINAVVRQNAEESLANDLTVKENLILRASPKSLIDRILPSVKLDSHIKEILEFHEELARKIDQPCRNLSGGQKQTLAFIAVASNRSPILCLDEFLSATDIDTSISLRRLARIYAETTPACVLIVSHDIDLALVEADRIMVLKAGKLVGDIKRNENNWNHDYILFMMKN